MINEAEETLTLKIKSVEGLDIREAVTEFVDGRYRSNHFIATREVDVTWVIPKSYLYQMLSDLSDAFDSEVIVYCWEGGANVTIYNGYNE